MKEIYKSKPNVNYSEDELLEMIPQYIIEQVLPKVNLSKSIDKIFYKTIKKYGIYIDFKIPIIQGNFDFTNLYLTLHISSRDPKMYLTPQSDNDGHISII